MTVYAVDCKTQGEYALAQKIAFKKGWDWIRGTQRVLSGTNKRLHLQPSKQLTHGMMGARYYPRTKVLSLSELNKLEV